MLCGPIVTSKAITMQREILSSKLEGFHGVGCLRQESAETTWPHCRLESYAPSSSTASSSQRSGFRHQTEGSLVVPPVEPSEVTSQETYKPRQKFLQGQNKHQERNLLTDLTVLVLHSFLIILVRGVLLPFNMLTVVKCLLVVLLSF